jgi:MFS family permease
VSLAGGDARLIWCIALGQAIGWGMLFSVFPLFVAPMEAELGWSRAEINTALALGLLASGLAALPAGHLVDRHGGRWLLALAACFAAYAFIATGLAAHAIPLLRERGLPEASVLLLVALHGPFQVAARAAMFGLGGRATMRGAGRLATLLVLLAMLVLASAPAHVAWLLLYAAAWAVADGLMTIIRAAGVAELLGRDGYGAVTGTLGMATTLPRTAAPLALALLWETSGGHGAVPWMLAGIGATGAAAFHRAARQS